MKNWLNQVIRRYHEPYGPVPAQYPERGHEEEWARMKLAYYSKHPHLDASDLFNVSSGDYIPRTIEVASSFKPEHLLMYRQLKSENPVAVQKAREKYSPWQHSITYDPEDMIGLSFHNDNDHVMIETLGY